MEETVTTVTTRPAAYTIPEAADQLRCSRSHIYKLIETGQLRRVRIGHRSIITAAEIDRILREGAEPEPGTGRGRPR
jgi:excisionase family DNA binding protein